LTIVTTLAVVCGHGLLCLTRTLALSLAQHDPPFVMFQLPHAFQKATYFFQEQTATQQSVDRLRWLHSLRLLCRRHTLKKLAPDRNLHEKLLTQFITVFLHNNSWPANHIAISNSFSKILETALYSFIECNDKTDNYQFGF